MDFCVTGLFVALFLSQWKPLLYLVVIHVFQLIIRAHKLRLVLFDRLIVKWLTFGLSINVTNGGCVPRKWWPRFKPWSKTRGEDGGHRAAVRRVMEEAQQRESRCWERGPVDKSDGVTPPPSRVSLVDLYECWSHSAAAHTHTQMHKSTCAHTHTRIPCTDSPTCVHTEGCVQAGARGQKSEMVRMLISRTGAAAFFDACNNTIKMPVPGEDTWVLLGRSQLHSGVMTYNKENTTCCRHELLLPLWFELKVGFQTAWCIETATTPVCQRLE